LNPTKKIRNYYIDKQQWFNYTDFNKVNKDRDGESKYFLNVTAIREW
jgi:hypothetical protein